MDLTTLTDAELEQHCMAVHAEIGRRRVALVTLPAQIDALAADYHRAQGIPGWVDPATTGVPYPKGFELTVAGKTWVSDKRMNLGAPGTVGWREVTNPGKGTP